MARARLPYKLRSYRELKMRGTFDTNTISNLLRVATKISLREVTLEEPYLAPIQDVDLYDVYHHDTGRRLPIGSHGDSARIFEPIVRKINIAPIVGHIAIQGMHFNCVGESDRYPEMHLIGGLQASSLHPIPSYDRVAEVTKILQDTSEPSTRWPLQIDGTVRIGEDFQVGYARFHASSSDQRDDLILLGFFNEPDEII